MRITKRLTMEIAQRVLADAIAINVALVVALVLHFLRLFIVTNGAPQASVAFYNAALQNSIHAYQDSAWLLTVTCLITFYASGFYTYGRTYHSRFKAVLILQAVTLSYLVLGSLVYVLSSSSLWSFTPLPLSAWAMGWFLTVLLVGGIRVGASLWRHVVWAEARIWGRPKYRPVRNVLVIGGAGYIGSIVVRKLLDQGYDVTVLDALVYGDESIRDLYGRHGFDLIHDDLRNIEPVVQALQYADAVIHLGALVGDPACALDERLTIEINLAATSMIAEAARGFGVQRFIFASTCSVYGASDQILDERSALNPVSLYARTKIESERALLALDDDDFASIILRFATIYGLSPRPRFDLVVNLLAARAAREKSITIFGGDQWRPFIHVDDVAEAILKCLEAPLSTVKGQIFNVGADEQNYCIAELGQLIKELMPEVQVEHRGEDVDCRNYRVSFAKIRRCLDFTPRYTVADGVLEIAAAIQQGIIADYRDARYSNYKTLSEDGNDHFIRSTRMTPLYSGSLEDPQVSPVIAPATSK